MSQNTDTAINDTTCSLSTLRARVGKPVRDVILDIHRQHRKSNDKSIWFLRNLKCFLPAETGDGSLHFCPDGQGKPVQTLLRPCSQVEHYVALSYPWYPSHGESNMKGGYHLPETTILVRDIVLDRTIRFIRYKQGRLGMIPFWIDQLSIDQDNDSEKEQGMQSMDLVYKNCDFAVGYLWVEIQTQVQVDCLSSLLNGQIVEEKANGEFPTLKKGIGVQTTDEVLDLLVQITDDQWWSRAWIYQEDYLAGTKMWLLIRHARGLHKPYAQNELGRLSGELVIKSDKFRKYVTLFCLALRQTDRRSSIKSTCEKVLQRAGKYNVLHKYRRGTCDSQRLMTTNILEDLNKRNISVPSDLLAIAANVCGYNIRILAPKKNALKMSLSLGILTLCICNGEIVGNGYGERALYQDVFDFFANHAMDISAPLPDGALTFMKHCRLSVGHLSKAGIHTKGFLWKLSDMIRPDRLRKTSLSYRKSPNQKGLYRHGLNDYQRSRLFDLVRVLNQRDKRRYKRLADDLEEYLRNRERPIRRDDWPPRFAMDVMAAGVVNAMDTGQYLQIARLIKGSPEGKQGKSCRAVFVRERNERHSSGPTYVFTSWTRTDDQVRDEVTCKTLAKYASMEVSFDGKAQHGMGSLRSKRWTNGLCFFDGEVKSSFIVAWPDLLCV